jgi:hypothetical protein
MIRRALPLLVALTTSALNAEEAAQEWQSLFDGKTLNGWTPVVDNGSFKVEDGALVAGGAAMDHLFYSGPVNEHVFVDFELKAQVMTTPGSNSGIFFHTKAQRGALLKGYEAQINTTHRDKRRTGSLIDVRDVFETATKDNEWFEYHIMVKGKRIVLKVDGVTVVDYTEPERPKRSERRAGRVLSSGQIALQGHDPNSRVYFRNIRVRPLDR